MKLFLGALALAGMAVAQDAEAPPPPRQAQEEAASPPPPPAPPAPAAAPPAPAPSAAEVAAAAAAADAAASVAEKAEIRQNAINGLGKAAEQGDLTAIDEYLAQVDVKTGKITSTEEYREGYTAYHQMLTAKPTNAVEVFNKLNTAGMDASFRQAHIGPPIWFASVQPVTMTLFDAILKATQPAAFDFRDQRGYDLLYTVARGCPQSGRSETDCTTLAKSLITAGATDTSAKEIATNDVYHWMRPMFGLTRSVAKTEEEV